MPNGNAANAGTDHPQRRLVEVAGQGFFFPRSGQRAKQTEDDRMMSVWCWAFALKR